MNYNEFKSFWNMMYNIFGCDTIGDVANILSIPRHKESIRELCKQNNINFDKIHFFC